MKKTIIIFAMTLIVIGALMAIPEIPQERQPLVNVITIEGPINPAMALYVNRGIEIAERNRAQAFIILMDTPGGLDDSMREIIKAFFISEVPIVVYVSPQGARAASAGAIICLASHVGAMSPGTAMGAAHPVGLGGDQPDETMSKKIAEDAAAYARSIAERRGRNVEWAELAVKESISSTEFEAKEKNVIDIIADDLDDLLAQLNELTVETTLGEVTINTENARVENIDPNLRERFLHIVGNPNVAYILMLIAVYGIIFELQNPGGILPGVAGGIALILALFSFAILPVNLAGILLIALGIGLLITEVFVPGFGILPAGGLTSFIVGSLILFEAPTPAFRVSITLIITMAILTGGFFLFAIGAAIRAQKGKIVTGAEGMVGEIVEAMSDINPTGKVFAEGGYWKAETIGGPIEKGEKVRIVAVEKLLLKVEKATKD